MFRNRVIGFTTAVFVGTTSIALAQTPAPNSQQRPQQPTTSQPAQPQRPTTQAPSTTQSQTQGRYQSPVMGQLVSVDTDEKTFIVAIDPAGAGASSGASGAQSGSAQSGSAQSGSAQPGSAQAGSAQSGSAQSGSSASRPSGSASAASNVEFSYDDSTTVTGAERGIAGLSAMKASRVTVHFTQTGGEMKATRIEVRPASSTTPSSSTSPSSPGSSSSPGSPSTPSTPRPQPNPNPDSPSTQPR
jgi:hypothetical protein